MIGLFFLAFLVFIAYHVLKSMYYINVDNTIVFSGAPGTGKTNEMITLALKLRRIKNNKIKTQNWFQRFKIPSKRRYKEKVVIYSNIPIRIGRLSKKEYQSILKSDKWQSYCKIHQIDPKTLSHDKFCNELEIGHLLNQIRLPEGCITVITELGKIASQYDWQNVNVQEHMDDWISLYRQYTKGGYFLADDQSSDNIAVLIRRRIGTVHNMLHFKRFWKIYWVRMRNMTISEDVKVIESETVEEQMKTHVGLFPLFHYNYDTYCFSDRYKGVPAAPSTQFIGFKTNKIMKLPETTRIKYQGQEEITGLLPTKLNEHDFRT